MSWLTSFLNGDPTATKAASSLTNTGAVSTSAGLADTTAGAKFFQGVLQGNTKSLAPQISSLQKQGGQKLQTAFQFGNRSGGTNAKAQQSSDDVTASINDLIAQFTNSAATNLSSLGTNLLNTGTSATQSGAQISLQNKSIVDQLLLSAGGAAGTAAGTYLGKLIAH